MNTRYKKHLEAFKNSVVLPSAVTYKYYNVIAIYMQSQTYHEI